MKLRWQSFVLLFVCGETNKEYNMNLLSKTLQSGYADACVHAEGGAVPINAKVI